MTCHCNTQRHDPDCHIDHTLSVLEADIAFPQRRQEINPNPMNARCGLEDCDCEYTIGGLVRRLELISEEALNTVKHTRQEAEALSDCHKELCGTVCPCYLDGHNVAEGIAEDRQPQERD